MKSHITKYLSVSCVLLLILIGCSQSSNMTNVSEPITATVTSSLLISKTPENQNPTKTFMVSETPHPSHTQEPQIKITWTPLPTMSLDDSRIFIREAIDTNLGCQLPCWWGTIPGETPWEETKHFLESFAIKIVPYPKNGSPINYGVYFPDPKDYENNFGLVYYVSPEEVTDVIIIPFINKSLSNVLEKYGIPSQIWFYSGGVTPNSQTHDFSLWLYYAEQGYMFIYNGQGGFFEDAGGLQVEVCREQIEDGWKLLMLWSPSSSKTFKDLEMLIEPGPEEYDRPLSDVTEMSVKTFVKLFSNPDNLECIRSPSNIWPFPLTDALDP